MRPRQKLILLSLQAICLVGAITPVGSQPLSAEDTPTNFYNKDFARDSYFTNDREEVGGERQQREQESNKQSQALIPKTQQNPRQPHSPFAPPEAATPNNALRHLPTLEASPTPESESDARTDLNQYALGSGLEVQSVSLIVNALDEKHFKQSVKELTDLAGATGVHAKTVYAVGNLDSLLPKSFTLAGLALNPKEQPALLLGLYGGNLALVEEPPRQYPVQRSPSWIITTAQGEYILEAVGPLHNYFNKKGQLVLTD